MNKRIGNSRSLRERTLLLVQEQAPQAKEREATPGPLAAVDASLGEQMRTFSTQTFTCASQLCHARRERHHKLGAQVLFNAVWKEIKMAGQPAWVVEITVSCPDCEQHQTRTLVPPVAAQ